MSKEIENKSFLFNRERFEEERVRLKETQESVAIKCGVSRVMWGKYERGVAIPGSNVLFAFAALGADLNYLATGIRSHTITEIQGEYRQLTKRQEALLDNFEHCPKEVQNAITRLALDLASATDKYDKAQEYKKLSNGD